MLQVTAPRLTGSQYTRPLLSLSKKVRRQKAASALRACWDRLTLKDQICRGMISSRWHIEHSSRENGSGSSPVFMLEEHSQQMGKILLCVFDDSSAVVWRCASPNQISEDLDEYRALPVVLRLSSVARIRDGAAINLKMRKEAPHRVGLFLENPGDSRRVSLTSGWTCGEGALDFEHRQELRSQLLNEAVAWAHLIDDLPALHKPPLGQPSSGIIDAETLREIGASPNARIAYAVPAFLDWRWLTLDEADELRSFAVEISAWFWFRHGAAVDIEIDTAPLQQKGTASPSVRACVTELPDGCRDQEAFRQRCTHTLQRILDSDLAPSGARKLLGQELIIYRDQLPWLDSIQVTRSFYNRKYCQMTSHEIIELHSRFDHLWSENFAQQKA